MKVATACQIVGIRRQLKMGGGAQTLVTESVFIGFVTVLVMLV